MSRSSRLREAGDVPLALFAALPALRAGTPRLTGRHRHALFLRDPPAERLSCSAAGDVSAAIAAIPAWNAEDDGNPANQAVRPLHQPLKSLSVTSTHIASATTTKPVATALQVAAWIAL